MLFEGRRQFSISYSILRCLRNMGCHPQKGVLFYGPPGCGDSFDELDPIAREPVMLQVVAVVLIGLEPTHYSQENCLCYRCCHQTWDYRPDYEFFEINVRQVWVNEKVNDPSKWHKMNRSLNRPREREFAEWIMKKEKKNISDIKIIFHW